MVLCCVTVFSVGSILVVGNNIWLRSKCGREITTEALAEEERDNGGDGEVVVGADERRWFGDGSWQMSNKRQRWRGEDG